MTNFANLKQNGSKSLEKLSEQLAKVTAPTFNNDDDRFWFPEVDKAGNGFAVIRFLDSPRGEEVPFVRLWEHRFKGPTGSWYVEKCLTTLGKQDPVAEMNNVLWNSGVEADKVIARERKRQLYFISNIIIIKDPEKPENEGGVRLFRYGKKIFDKLLDQMNTEKVNPYNFWTGANFKLKIRAVEGYRNYDMSSFDSPSPLHADDTVIEKIWNQEHALQPFIDETSFKSYDELKAKLDRVLGTTKPRAAVEEKPNVVVPFGEHSPAQDDDEPEDITDRLKFFQQMKNAD